MPLKNENRIIVKQGLKSLMENPRPGLSDMLFKLDLAGKRISATEISWQLSPAINSAGRMGNPAKAAALFLEKDPKILDSLANELITMNDERKKLGNEIWTLVEPQAEQSLKSFAGNLAAAYSEKIPRGITGIMANKMAGRFKVPSMAASFGDIIIGSLRSVRGYDLRFLLEPCADLFLDWGGHDYAAGFSLEKEKWPIFLERLKLAAERMELEEIQDEDVIEVDAELPLSFMNPDILNVVDRFEPYGEGNDALNFMARGARIDSINLMGKTETKHVKLSLDMGKHKWPAVYWQAADKVKRDFDLEDRVDLVFRINRNWFNGNETPQLIVSDMNRSDTKRSEK
jgi:single-stranded-DNA-specific exonuclease